MSEAEALAKYDTLLWKHVHAFSFLTRYHAIAIDDLIQEARLAFLQYIRTHDESMWVACPLTIKGALLDYARRNYPLCVSRHAIGEELRKETVFISSDKILGENKLETEDDYSDIDLRSAIDQLTKKEQELVLMRLEGMSIEQIAQRMDRSHQVISYRLKAIRRKIVA